MEARRGPLFWVYCALAALGAILPYAILLPWLAEHGIDVGLFGSQLFATAPTSAFAADVLFAAAVFLIFVMAEGNRLGMRGLWLAPIVLLAIGLCCALQLFLAQRERVLSRHS